MSGLSGLSGLSSIFGAIDPSLIAWWIPSPQTRQYMADITGRNAALDLGAAVSYVSDAGVPGGYMVTTTNDWMEPQTRNGFQVRAVTTCTGICVDTTDDCLWIGGYTQTKILKCTRAGDVLATITTTAGSQGVTHDTSDNTLWWSDYDNSFLRHITKAGADAGGAISLGYQPSGCAYEPSTDSIWVVPAGTVTIKRHSCTDGSLLETLTVTGYTGLDGVGYDATNDTLWITADSPTLKITNVNSSTGAVISEFASGAQPEGIAVDTDGTLWYADDAEFHSSTKFGNRIYHKSRLGVDLLTPAAIVLPTMPFTIETWFRVDTGGALATVFWCGNNAGDSETFSIYLRGDQTNQIQAWHRNAGDGIATAAIPFVVGTLYHVVAVFASTTSRKIYVNGGNGGTDTSSRAAPASNKMSFFQSRRATPGIQLNGDLGPIRIWNRELSAAEIAAL